MTWRSLAGLALAALLLDLVLIQPNHPQAMTWGALRLFPLELPVLLLAMLAIPGGSLLSRVLRLALTAALVTVAVLKLADFAMFTALNRGFNPVMDLPLAVAGWRLGSGAIGVPAAAAVVLAALAAVVAVALLLWWALARWAATEPRPVFRAAAGLGAVLAALVATAEIGQAMRRWHLPVDLPGAAFTARVGLERVAMVRQARADLAEFRQQAGTDRWTDGAGLFDRLGGRDVLIVFVESYGHASLSNPRYAGTHVPTLQAAGRDLTAAGLSMRSGWLVSPTSGGQSWLAHATLSSGLRIDSQSRHGALLSTPRRTLFHLAREAGYRTVAVMPAITLPWPEGPMMGFETVLPAAALGYRGQPFNWITMPDQFVHAAWDALVPRDRPRFVQMATVSSHAPWVPVPEMLPWEDLGDGTVFDRWALSGDPPEVVWKDVERIRDQYRMAIDYALRAVTSDALRRAADPPLTVVLGDHQPVEFVSGDSGHAVPVHLIGPPQVLQLFDGWGWTPGLLPDPDLVPVPMESFRDMFLRATSSPGGRPRA